MKTISIFSTALLILFSLAFNTFEDFKIINASKIQIDTPFYPTYGSAINCLAVEPISYGSNVYISNSDSFFVSKFDTIGNFISQHQMVHADAA